jgi:hypothetical protein
MTSTGSGSRPRTGSRGPLQHSHGHRDHEARFVEARASRALSPAPSSSRRPSAPRSDQTTPGRPQRVLRRRPVADPDAVREAGAERLDDRFLGRETLREEVAPRALRAVRGAGSAPASSGISRRSTKRGPNCRRLPATRVDPHRTSVPIPKIIRAALRHHQALHLGEPPPRARRTPRGPMIACPMLSSARDTMAWPTTSGHRRDRLHVVVVAARGRR